MRHLFMGIATALVVTGSAAVLTSGAQAAAGAGNGLNSAAGALSNVEKTQFLFGGRRHCWYGDGWHGAGWYWCGYRTRAGLGWGGAEGWNGWRTPERVRRIREHRT